MKKKDWVGFDLGGTKMLAKIYKGDGDKSLASVKAPTEGHRGAKTGLKRISDTIEKAVREAEIDIDEIAGIGIARLPDFFVGPGLADGRLVRLLEDHEPDPSRIWAVYPHRRHLSAKVRLTVERLATFLAETCSMG